MLMFERELAAFRAALPRLVPKAEGQYAVVHEDSVMHLATDLEAALDWAFERYEAGQFMVKQVTASEPIAHYTRSVGPCAN